MSVGKRMYLMMQNSQIMLSLKVSKGLISYHYQDNMAVYIRVVMQGTQDRNKLPINFIKQLKMFHLQLE